MSSIQLLKSRRFLPYFITQFGGAFNDSLVRRAVEMMIAFQGMSGAISPEIAIYLLLGLFMSPFFVCSAFAGYLADTCRKDRLVRYIKISEIAIVAFGAYGLLSGSLFFGALAVLGLGVHSAFFGPVKYSLPSQQLESAELIAANGLIEAGTNAAILLGTIIGSALVGFSFGPLVISVIALMASVVGLVASFSILPAPAVAGVGLRQRGTIELLSRVYHDNDLWRLTLGISWFWTLGALLISLFSLVVKDLLSSTPLCVTIFFTIFSLGIGVGSLLCNRILKGEIAATWTPMAALVMAFSLFVFYLLLPVEPQAPISAMALLLSLKGLSICGALLLLSVAGGIYVVPLYGVLQSRTELAERSQVIAANNIMNAVMMVAGSLLFALLFQLGLSVSFTVFLLGVLNLGAALYACLLLPESLIKSVLQLFFRSLFRARVEGLQHLTNAGPKALIVANHLSFLDAVMLGAFLPDRVTFAVNTEISRQWWMKPAMWFLDMIAIDPANPMAIRILIDRVKNNGKVVIFPEGRITVTGTLMKIYEGPAMIADKADAPLIPVRLEGFQYTIFSKVTNLFRWKLFPQLSLTVLEPVRLKVNPELRGRKRREQLGLALHDLMTELMYMTNQRGPTLLHAIRRTMSVVGSSRVIAKDPLGNSVTMAGIIKRSFVLSRLMPEIAAAESTIGLLLPSGVPLLLFIFAFHWKRKTPALLNYSHSPEQMVATCAVADIKLVITSRRFIGIAKLEAHRERLQASGIEFSYLEDTQSRITTRRKLLALTALYGEKLRASLAGRDVIPGDKDDSAVVLFTSGSEGSPKGVVLSHMNLLTNIDQVTSSVPVMPSDRFFNALPMFHSFGLTGGTLMPIVKGVPVMIYPSPLHYRIIPEMVYSESATVLFGTPTFLAGYARKAHPYDFFTVRYVFSGAERMPDALRAIYMERFGLRIFEGYGATETAPVLSINTPFYARRGTVGRLLPGIEYRLETIPGIPTGGRLHVRGPNVMKGYLKIDKPGILQPLEDGWYDTGDIVSVDENGFITIQGRAKRFAKIAGEMVSLTALEQALDAQWPESLHCVVAVPDARKGERLVLVTTFAQADRESVSKALKERGIPEIGIPRSILTRRDIPLLGSGKVDVQQVTRLVHEQQPATAEEE